MEEINIRVTKKTIDIISELKEKSDCFDDSHVVTRSLKFMHHFYNNYMDENGKMLIKDPTNNDLIEFSIID